MKQLAIVGLVGVVILGGGYYFSSSKKTSTTPISQAENVNESTPIRLIKESGLVTWKKTNDANYTRVEQDEVMIPNDVSVKTGLGRGYVILPDNSSISLNQNTEIIVSYTPEKISIMQLLGSTYHRVMTLASGKSYEVRTPGTLAAVRGTKFAVAYDDMKKKTQVSVTEHVVAVTTDTDSPSSQTESYSAKEGETITVDAVTVDGASSTTSDTSSSTPNTKTEFHIRTKLLPNKDMLVPFIAENRNIDMVYDTKTDKPKFIKDMLTDIRVETNKVENKDVKTSTGESAVPEEMKQKRRDLILKKTLEIIKKTPESIVDSKDTKVSEDVRASNEGKERSKVTAPTVTTKGDGKAVVALPSKKLGVKETFDTSLKTNVDTASLKAFDITKEDPTPSESAFIDTFYAVYEKYLYVDDNAMVCTTLRGMTAKDIIVKLEAVSTRGGYTLPKKEQMTALANNVVAACADGSIKDKIKSLETAFDVAYPYSE